MSNAATIFVSNLINNRTVDVLTSMLKALS